MIKIKEQLLGFNIHLCIQGIIRICTDSFFKVHQGITVITCLDSNIKNTKINYRLFLITVFPNVPQRPGMPCVGEDSKLLTTESVF